MKAPLEISDELYEQVKAAASLRNETPETFIVEVLSKHLQADLKAAPLLGEIEQESRDRARESEGEPLGQPGKVAPEVWLREQEKFLEMMRKGEWDGKSAVELIREGRR